MSVRKEQSTEAAVREIRRRTRRKFAPPVHPGVGFSLISATARSMQERQKTSPHSPWNRTIGSPTDINPEHALHVLSSASRSATSPCRLCSGKNLLMAPQHPQRRLFQKARPGRRILTARGSV
jgi:hypothetical protein